MFWYLEGRTHLFDIICIPLLQADWSQRMAYIYHSSLRTFLTLCCHPVDTRGTRWVTCESSVVVYEISFFQNQILISLSCAEKTFCRSFCLCHESEWVSHQLNLCSTVVSVTLKWACPFQKAHQSWSLKTLSHKLINDQHSKSIIYMQCNMRFDATKRELHEISILKSLSHNMKAAVWDEQFVSCLLECSLHPTITTWLYLTHLKGTEHGSQLWSSGYEHSGITRASCF